MKAFSYTKSRILIEDLSKIENLNKELLLTSISPADKLHLRWNKTIAQIFYGLMLAGYQFENLAEVKLSLKTSKNNGANRKQQEVVAYKRGLDNLYYEWLVVNKPVNAQDIVLLYEALYEARFQGNASDLERSLQYIQASPDNPIIQAALAQILVISGDYFGRETAQMAQLTGILFLYKRGYDFRRMMVLEEYYYRQGEQYNRLLAESLRSTNITSWLEFVVDAVVFQLQKLLQDIHNLKFQSDQTKNINALTERQKEILQIIEEPGLKITNRDLQKRFKISAITSARDLARLANLGVIFSIGRGRSTYYTKT